MSGAGGGRLPAVDFAEPRQHASLPTDRGSSGKGTRGPRNVCVAGFMAREGRTARGGHGEQATGRSAEEQRTGASPRSRMARAARLRPVPARHSRSAHSFCPRRRRGSPSCGCRRSPISLDGLDQLARAEGLVPQLLAQLPQVTNGSITQSMIRRLTCGTGRRPRIVRQPLRMTAARAGLPRPEEEPHDPDEGVPPELCLRACHRSVVVDQIEVTTPASTAPPTTRFPSPQTISTAAIEVAGVRPPGVPVRPVAPPPGGGVPAAATFAAAARPPKQDRLPAADAGEGLDHATDGRAARSLRPFGGLR